jgi:hypothetical protein
MPFHLARRRPMDLLPREVVIGRYLTSWERGDAVVAWVDREAS